jgi:hypothetical protein
VEVSYAPAAFTVAASKTALRLSKENGPFSFPARPESSFLHLKALLIVSFVSVEILDAFVPRGAYISFTINNNGIGFKTPIALPRMKGNRP